MKRILLTLLLVFLSFSIFAENFYIDSYDVKINVMEDGKAHIDERLSVIFTKPSHGIYRDIQCTFNNPINKWKEIRAEVSNIESNLPLYIEKSYNVVSLRLGDENKYLTGRQEIAISYDYDLGGDIYPNDYDEFYYNIISPDWDCTISNITYNAAFPKKIDKNRIWVTFGDYGSTAKALFSLSNNGLNVTGRINRLDRKPRNNNKSRNG